MLTGSAYMRQPWGVSKVYGIAIPTTAVAVHPERAAGAYGCGQPLSAGCSFTGSFGWRRRGAHITRGLRGGG